MAISTSSFNYVPSFTIEDNTLSFSVDGPCPVMPSTQVALANLYAMEHGYVLLLDTYDCDSCYDGFADTVSYISFEIEPIPSYMVRK